MIMDWQVKEATIQGVQSGPGRRLGSVPADEASADKGLFAIREHTSDDDEGNFAGVEPETSCDFEGNVHLMPKELVNTGDCSTRGGLKGERVGCLLAGFPAYDLPSSLNLDIDACLISKIFFDDLAYFRAGYGKPCQVLFFELNQADAAVINPEPVLYVNQCHNVSDEALGRPFGRSDYMDFADSIPGI